MNKEELQQIADQSNFTWIKVRKFNNEDYATDVEELMSLKIHHKTETTFLINKCRELAARIIELQEENMKIKRDAAGFL